MKRMLICGLLLASAAGASQEPVGPTAAVPTGSAASPVAGSVSLSTLARESRLAIEALEAQAATATQGEELQRRIVELKLQFELRRLELLAAECREQGREDEALQAEARLAELLNPAPRSSVPPAELSPEEKAALQARLPKLENIHAAPRAAGLPSDAEGGSR